MCYFRKYFQGFDLLLFNICFSRHGLLSAFPFLLRYLSIKSIVASTSEFPFISLLCLYFAGLTKSPGQTAYSVVIPVTPRSQHGLKVDTDLIP